MHLGKRPPHHSEPALLREQRATDVFTDTGRGSARHLEHGVVAAQKTNDLQLRLAGDSPSFEHPWGRLISTDHSARPLVRCPCAQDHITSSSESRDSADFTAEGQAAAGVVATAQPASYRPERSWRDPRGPSPAPPSVVQGLPKCPKTCLLCHRPHPTR